MSQPKPHKHAALIRQWADLVAKGEVAAGWWNYRHRGRDDYPWNHEDGTAPTWNKLVDYEIVKTEKHPDNAKPVLDWSKVPVGAMTDRGIFLGLRGESFFTGPPNDVDAVFFVKMEEPTLTPMTMWFDGQPTDEQRAMFDCEVRHVVDQMTGLFVQHGFWRIKGARK